MQTKSNIFIIYPNFYNIDTDSYSVGGVQTYIYYLSKLILRKSFQPIVIQISQKDFSLTKDDIIIKGYKPQKNIKPNLALFRQVLKEFVDNRDLIIFGSENFSVKTKITRSILIQHGIFWDLPSSVLPAGFLFKYLPSKANRIYIQNKVLNNFRNCKTKVCVDYNYLNWYRTKTDIFEDEKIHIIPNFTIIDEKLTENDVILKHENDIIIKVLFARRFVEMRGVKLVTNLLKKMEIEYPNVKFTFAGEGPLFNEIENLENYHTNVKLVKYKQIDALEIHKQHHIAIIPSLGSEGTSISVAEAMAAGCAVIATNIGGITNMIIDNYNGCLINPIEQELYTKLEELIISKEKRKTIAVNGFHVASEGFNIANWNEKWSIVLDNILETRSM